MYFDGFLVENGCVCVCVYFFLFFSFHGLFSCSFGWFVKW